MGVHSLPGREEREGRKQGETGLRRRAESNSRNQIQTGTITRRALLVSLLSSLSTKQECPQSPSPYTINQTPRPQTREHPSCLSFLPRSPTRAGAGRPVVPFHLPRDWVETSDLYVPSLLSGNQGIAIRHPRWLICVASRRAV